MIYSNYTLICSDWPVQCAFWFVDSNCYLTFWLVCSNYFRNRTLKLLFNWSFQTERLSGELRIRGPLRRKEMDQTSSVAESCNWRHLVFHIHQSLDCENCVYSVIIRLFWFWVSDTEIEIMLGKEKSTWRPRILETWKKAPIWLGPGCWAWRLRYHN